MGLSSTSSFQLHVCIIVLLLIITLIQIMFFVLLPHIQLFPNFCNSTITSKTLTGKTSTALERPMHLFYRSLYLSPHEIAIREKEEQQERERLAIMDSTPMIRADPGISDKNPLMRKENDITTMFKGHFLQGMGQGHESPNSSASYCINLITPSDSPGVLHDFELYLNALPSSRPIYAFHGRTVVPPSVIDVYLERHPIDTKYYQQWTLPKEKTIWMMQNTEFFDRHELSNPDVGVMIVKNRIGLQKVLEYRHRHQMEYTVFYTKHTSQDIFDPSIERDWTSFLHLAGWSPFKNTKVIVQAWKKHPEWPKLVLRVMKQDLCDWIERQCGSVDEWTVSNIDYKCGNEPLESKIKLQNQMGIHLCPSETEGFGHYINEARSAGVLIVTTNVAPMNELVDDKSGILIGQAREWWWQTKGDLFMPLAYVTIEDIERAVERILLMSVEERKRIGRRSRAKYLEDRTFFLNAMAALEASICRDEIQINRLLPYLY